MNGTLSIRLYGDGFSYNADDDEPCYNFNDEHKNAHWKLWEKINDYLRRRGFKVTACPKMVKGYYRSLSKNHRYGIKNGLEFHTDRYPRGFKYEFYQNFNFENPNGGRYDHDKYSKMPYRIKLTFRNELTRLAEFVKSLGVKVEIEKHLSDIEHILERENENTHIHHPTKPITSLDELKELIASNDSVSAYNAKDANDKLMECGQEKYFYDYNDRLAKGIVYHNINNMWWVIVNGKSYNKCCRDFFDKPEVIKRKLSLTIPQQVERLNQELVKCEKKQDYVRCIVLKTLLDSYKLYNVWSIRNNAWWSGNNAGYTSNRRNAGVYLESEINSNKMYYNNGTDTVAKPLER